MDTVDDKQTFPTMRARMDALIKARKEQPEKRGTWNRLNTALRDMATNPDDIKYLTTAFAEIEHQERMDLWDNQFFESLITTDTPREEVLYSRNPYVAPAVTIPGQIITTDTTAPMRTLNATQAKVANQLGLSSGQYAKIIDALSTEEKI